MNGELTFTSSVFPRCIKRYQQILYPLAVSVNLFNSEENDEITDVFKCSFCGTFMTVPVNRKDGSSYFKCPLCQTDNIHQESKRSAREVELEEKINNDTSPKLLILIDFSEAANNNGTYKKAIEVLNNSLCDDIYDIAIAAVSESITFFTDKSGLITITDFDSAAIPPNVFNKNKPTNIDLLATFARDNESRKKFRINDALRVCKDILDEYSYIVLFAGSIGDISEDLVKIHILQKKIYCSCIYFTEYYNKYQGYESLTRILNGNYMVIFPSQKNYEDDIKNIINAKPCIVSINATDDVILSDSIGYENKTPNNFLALSNTSFLFPCELKELGEKVVPFTLMLRYYDFRGFWHNRVVVRNIELSRDLCEMLKYSNEKVLLKYIMCRLIEDYIQNKSCVMSAINILWPFLYRYQVYVLDQPINEEKLFIPKRMSKLDENVCKILHSLPFVGTTSPIFRTYLFRAISSKLPNDLEQVWNSTLADEYRNDVNFSIDELSKEAGYTFYNGYATFYINKEICMPDEKGYVRITDVSDAGIRSLMYRSDYNDNPGLDKFRELLLDKVVTESRRPVISLDD